MTDNIILMGDSYKYSQFNQYPPGTTEVYSYIESRGGAYDKTVFFGAQAFIKRYLTKCITQEMIDHADRVVRANGMPFYREGWEYILDVHDGRLPIIISTVDEGTVVPTGNVLVTVYNTDPNCWWLTSFLETALLRAIWYPTTVASNSYHSKEIILEYLHRTGDPSLISYKLHDFGARGVSSSESAAIGGAAHLINFMGSDTIEAMPFISDYYGGSDAEGHSIPAMEHSTVTSWGRDHEVDSYANMLRLYGKPGSTLACVSDSYDIYEACRLWGTTLKQQVIDSGATVVIRPDSGDPAEVVTKCLQILDAHFGSTVNSKGYRVLNNVRIIQGDGIDHRSIRAILFSVTLAGYSADNVAFGQGGALLQMVNRDDFKFAMKCSNIIVNGESRFVFKDPITDKGKRSKKGKMILVKEGNSLRTITSAETEYASRIYDNLLKLRFSYGGLINETNFAEVRARANIS